VIISTFSEEQRQYIFDDILKNFETLATDKQGLCVIKKLIEQTKSLKLRQLIVDILSKNVAMYVQNEYGNFVVSEVLQQYAYETCRDIYTNIKGLFVKLSQNKYSSKFIENSIEQAPVEKQKEIIQEFVDSSNLEKVVESDFGNYVLQNTLKKYCHGCHDAKLDLIEAIIDCLPNVSEYKIQ